jgi:arsenical pump membrane protein
LIDPGVARAVSFGVCGVTLIAVATRAAGLSEALWATCGALLLVAAGGVSVHEALVAVSRGTDVYLFLAGMMVLAGLLRYHGVFAWLAMHALSAARGSALRLLGLVYLVGVAVTALLSNDATAVVLAPAVASALARTGARPLPYLYACAFVANAASFLLPISNPANLILYGDRLPPLGAWLAAFGLASLAAIVLTLVALVAVMRGSLRDDVADTSEPVSLTSAGRLAVALAGFSALAMVAAAVFAYPLGRVTILAAAISLGAISLSRPSTAAAVARTTAWSIVPLVAGLFVVVAALDRLGLAALARTGMLAAQALPGTLGPGALSAAITFACVLANNLPVALLAGVSLAGMHAHPVIAHTALVAVDLGPNLAVSGSLATLLWLRALRHEGIVVTPGEFARIGACVLAPALIGAVLVVH